MSTKGRFVWYDLMTTDMDAAIAFYTETIGWKVQHWGNEPSPYRMWAVGEQGIGGVMALTDEMKKMGVPPHWMAYVAVDDVDAAAKEAKALGGQILKGGTDIEKVGRFAVIADPQGASIALFKGEGEWTAPPRDKAGVVSWHELNTTDYEGAWKFYSKLFGWAESSSFDMGPEMGKYFMFKHPEDQGDMAAMGGMSNAGKTMSMPPHWLYYVNVDGIDAAIKRIGDKGGKVLNGPMDVPGGGKIAQCMDPQGAAFAVFSKP